MPIPLRPNANRFPIHVLPEALDVPGVLADQQWFEIEINNLFRDLRCERRVAHPYMAVIREYFDNQPAMKCKGSHRGFWQFQKIHRIGAEMRRQWDGLAAPAHDAGANLGDLHEAPS